MGEYYKELDLRIKPIKLIFNPKKKLVTFCIEKKVITK